MSPHSRSSSRPCATRCAAAAPCPRQADIAFHRLIVEASGEFGLEQCWKSLGVEGRIPVSSTAPTWIRRRPRSGTYSCSTRSARRARAPRARARKHVEVSARLVRARLGPLADDGRPRRHLGRPRGRERRGRRAAAAHDTALPCRAGVPPVRRPVDVDDPNRFIIFERYADDAASTRTRRAHTSRSSCSGEDSPRLETRQRTTLIPLA